VADRVVVSTLSEILLRRSARDKK